jgi:hypothetical protein
MKGGSIRIGTYKCRKSLHYQVGTIFESSHVKMYLWLQTIFLMALACPLKSGPPCRIALAMEDDGLPRKGREA